MQYIYNGYVSLGGRFPLFIYQTLVKFDFVRSDQPLILKLRNLLLEIKDLRHETNF